MRDALGRGEWAFFLQNRRGFTTWLLCSACGHVLKCRQCDVTLTFHKALNTTQMKERLAGQGIDGIASTPERLTQHLRVELEKWTAVVKAAGLKAD